ncbi:MAG: hypothetical protein LBS88_13570 [Tannerellaceae bacterium]|nr:hypothetical protein [Tannerellaceae bacterium]
MMKRFNIFLISPLLALLWACGVSTSGGDFYIPSPSENTGQGGSMARFTISGNNLYTVDQNTLKTFDVSRAETPKYLEGKEQYLDFGVETIFPMDTLLFLGSQTGMYIFNITRPDFPQQLAHVSHITACDPVVAYGRYAYVTLNSENTWCGQSANELRIYDLSNIYKPQLIHTESGFKHPKGLGIDGNKLFVCDNGLKVYDVSNPAQPLWIDDITGIPEAIGIDSYDVIPLNGTLLLIGANGLYQFDYTGESLSFLSKIEVLPER